MTTDPKNNHASILDRLIRYCLEHRFVVILFLLGGVLWGILVAPFDWKPALHIGNHEIVLPRDPVPVDAIPDIGENQQIVFTKWMGRSPQDMEDQITYPLTVALLGIPGVKTIRSYSMLGFSTIYVIFEEEIEFYWSRSRILEKLNSLPSGTLPDNVQPSLGPDATALGQVFWYTLEGRDKHGQPIGGWDLHELRSAQDWIVRYGLMSAEGVSEVASVGGFVQEYQIDINPDAMRASGVGLDQIVNAVRSNNIDVGARTIEVNKVEYVIRGLGFVETLDDIEATVIKAADRVPVRIGDIANITLGPALRRGALDKEGTEAVGGVVVVRFGENPLQVIQNVKDKILEIQPGLPEKILADGTVSQITIVPFYDRSGLIHETLDTLNMALEDEILVTMIVIILMVFHLRSSVLIAGLLPVTVLLCFIGMKTFNVDANIVALSGIAIAIGTIVDMGIVICENILKHLDEADPDENRLEVVYRASTEVGSAVLTAVATTVIGFLPVFTMEAAEGKLFQPLAYTKSFALIASVVAALTILPPLAHLLFAFRIDRRRPKQILSLLTIGLGAWIGWKYNIWSGGIITLFGVYFLTHEALPKWLAVLIQRTVNIIAAVFVLIFFTNHWEPLGPEHGFTQNIILVGSLIGGLLLQFYLIRLTYPTVLRFCLSNKIAVLLVSTFIVMSGFTVWLGFDRVWGWLPEPVRRSQTTVAVAHAFPGLGKEFMPALDEGSFLYMPTTMPHASIGEAMDSLQKIDMAIASIPEVTTVVGKIGRADTPLDPAPVSMVETVINYQSEYITNEKGKRLLFQFNREANEFTRDESNHLIPDEDGRPFRQWRDHIHSPQDIWNEILDAAQLPGVTSAPKLQPIETRIVMLQSGMRAPMGVKVKGPDLETIEKVGMEIERFLKEVPSIEPATVLADRVVGKPYLEINIDRQRIARYGLSIRKVQNVIESAIGGKVITQTVEGRERYPVRVRYQRELRDDIESLKRILVASPDGAQIPLIELATIEYSRGPQVIKSEDTFLISYVLFSSKPGHAEVDIVEEAKAWLNHKIEAGEFDLPDGVSYTFAGTYENQIRASRRLALVVPIALAIIFLILYFQFTSILTTMIVFSGIIIAWSGGFIMLWLYGQSWFADVSVFDENLRELFQIHPINLSVAVWVGFLALFGIASDNGVILATYLKQSFAKRQPDSIEAIRKATVEAGIRRCRPCLMTNATTILALLPILTSTGRGSDIMIPMAIPTFGGMLLVLLTMYTVPTLYCTIEEWKHRLTSRPMTPTA